MGQSTNSMLYDLRWRVKSVIISRIHEKNIACSVVSYCYTIMWMHLSYFKIIYIVFIRLSQACNNFSFVEVNKNHQLWYLPLFRTFCYIEHLFSIDSPTASWLTIFFKSFYVFYLCSK